MEKIVLVVMVLVALMTMPSVQSADDPAKVTDWYRALHGAKEKTTHLHFYFHDIVSGKNPTAITIANAPSTAKSPTLFGTLVVTDDPLTAGPDINSEPVGRAQGTYAFADQNTMGLLMTLNYVFTGKLYNGSTLSILGRNPFLETYREESIVGGTGFFRLARGTAISNNYFLNATSGDAILEYNVVVKHY